MLVFLSASKKKVSSFVTPTVSYSVNVGSVSADSFIFGYKNTSILTSSKKDAAFSAGSLVPSANVYYVGASAFASSMSSATSSVKISTMDSAYLYASSTFDPTKNKTTFVSFAPGKFLFPSKNDTTNVGFVSVFLLKNGQSTNGIISMKSNTQNRKLVMPSTTAISSDVIQMVAPHFGYVKFTSVYSATVTKKFAAFTAETI